MTKRILLFLFSILAPLFSLQAQVATVIEDVTEVDYRSAHNCTTRRKTVVQVNNEHGLKFAAFTVGCDASTTLASFNGEVCYAAGGKTKKIKKGDLLRSEYSAMLATDAYHFFYSPSPASYPFTVTYEWTVHCTDAVLCLDVFWPQPGFDVDVEHCSYSVVHAPDVQIHHELVGVKEEAREVMSSDGRPGLMLELSDLPAVKEERFLPPSDQLFPHAYFVPSAFTFGSTSGSLSSWQSFGQWLGSLCEGRGVLPDALKAKLHALTDSLANPRERLLKVYRLLEDETRYVSIQLGIGGMQPASATDVCRHGFGDCKGLSNLMVACLREVGIEADYVVIGTKHENLPADFANPALLDHAIVRAHMPDGEVWVECTNPQLPLGYVHGSIAGHEALVIPPASSSSSSVVRLPRYSVAENVDSIGITVWLAGGGTAQMSVEEQERNLMYEVDKYLLDLSPAKQRDHLRSQLTLPSFDFTKHVVEQGYGAKDERLAVLNVKYEGSCPKYASATGHRLFVPLLPYGSLSPIASSCQRANPVQMASDDYQRIYHLELFVPEGYKVEHLPAELSRVTEAGTVRSSVSYFPSAEEDGGSSGGPSTQLRTGRIVIDVHICASRAVLPAEGFADFNAFVASIADFFNAKIVLSSI